MVPSPPIWGCLVMTMDCRAEETFPLRSGPIRNHKNSGWGGIHTYRIMMETQLAHEIAEFLILQSHTSKYGV